MRPELPRGINRSRWSLDRPQGIRFDRNTQSTILTTVILDDPIDPIDLGYCCTYSMDKPPTVMMSKMETVKEGGLVPTICWELP